MMWSVQVIIQDNLPLAKLLQIIYFKQYHTQLTIIQTTQ